MTKLSRTKTIPINRLPGTTAHSLLLFIGFPKSEIKSRTDFWNVHHEILDWMLKEARRLYKEQMKTAHPDRGGSAKEAQTLNAAMDRLEDLFKYRGRRPMVFRMRVKGRWTKHEDIEKLAC